MIVILTANEKGKIELTEEELQKLLKEARDEGYNEGISKNILPISYPIVSPTYPITPEPTWIWNPWWYEVTCKDDSTYTYSTTTDADTTVR